MAVHVSHASLPYPIRKARYSFRVELFDTTGAPIAPSSADSEFSLDNGNYGDCAEELAVPGTNRGGGLITLTGAEMDGSLVGYRCGSSGAVDAKVNLYPRDLPILFSFTASAGANGSVTAPATIPAWAQAAGALIGAILRTTGGTGGGGTGGASNQARVISAQDASRVLSVPTNWETNPDNTTTIDVLLTPEFIARISLLHLSSQNFTPLESAGIVSLGTMAAGGTTASGTLPAGQRANVKPGDILVIPSTGDRGRIKTINTTSGAWTIDVGETFGTDPSSLPYVIYVNPISLPLVAADFGDGALTNAKFETSLALIKAATDRIPGFSTIPVTVGAGAHTATTIIASSATGYGNDRLNGRAMMFLSGTLAGTLVKITDYASATGRIDFQNLLGAAAAAAPAETNTAVII